MLVSKWMTENVITIDADESMQEAINTLRKKGIKLLPVMEKGYMIGIISDRDLKKASPSDATSLDIHELIYLTSKIRVRDLMTPNPVSVSPDYTIEEAAAVLLGKGISGLPVTDKKGKLVGIITKSDIFRVLISIFGQGKRGMQFAIRLEDTPGSIKKIRHIIDSFKSRTASLMSSDFNVPKGFINAYFRIYDIDRDVFRKLVSEIKKHGTLLYTIDHRDGSRTVYE